MFLTREGWESRKALAYDRQIMKNRRGKPSSNGEDSCGLYVKGEELRLKAGMGVGEAMGEGPAGRWTFLGWVHVA